MLRGNWEMYTKHKIKTDSGAQRTLQLCCAYPKTKNTESGELELKNVGGESKYKNNLIIHKTIINLR